MYVISMSFEQAIDVTQNLMNQNRIKEVPC